MLLLGAPLGERHLLWRLDHVPHLVLHLLEVIDKLVLTLILDVAHLFADLLLERSVALRLLSLMLSSGGLFKLTVDQDKGSRRLLFSSL